MNTKIQCLKIRTMNEKSKNPFEAQPDWQHNACMNSSLQIGNSMTTSLQFWELGDYYARSADALVRDAEDDRSLLDVYVSPLVFLYRHAFELFLKDLLWQSHYLAFGTKGFIKERDFRTHDLSKLWKRLKVNCQIVLGTALLASGHDIEILEQLFDQIQKQDPSSDAFRFR